MNVILVEGKEVNSERFARRESKKAANDGKLLKEAADQQKYMSIGVRRLLKEKNPKKMQRHTSYRPNAAKTGKLQTVRIERTKKR